VVGRVSTTTTREAPPAADPSKGTNSRLRGAWALIACIAATAVGAGSCRRPGITNVEKANSVPPVTSEVTAVFSHSIRIVVVSVRVSIVMLLS